MKRLALALVAALASPAAAQPAQTPFDPASVLGRWVTRSPFMEGELQLKSGGRYESWLSVPGAHPPHEQGTFDATADSLVIHTPERAITYEADWRGEDLILSGGNFTMPLQYHRTAGIALEKPADTAGDAEWRAKIAVAPLAAKPGTLVFAAAQDYVWTSPTKSSERWKFLPDGRVQQASVRVDAKGETKRAVWGTYELTATDDLRVRFEDGTKTQARLTSGRRTLDDGGGLIYTNAAVTAAADPHPASPR